MKNKSPLSAAVYLKANKGRTAVCIFMMFLETLMFLTGNYIHSEIAAFDVDVKYSDSYVETSCQSNDENYRDFYAFVDDIENDDKLESVRLTAQGVGGFAFNSVLNLEFGGRGYVFNSVDDMKKVFDHWGIECDLTNCKDRSIVVSKTLADNRGIKLGDKLDKSFDGNLEFEVMVDAIIDDGSMAVYYIYEVEPENLLRINIFSDTMEGEELYDYVRKIAGDRKIQIFDPMREHLKSDFSIFDMLFYIVDILISVVLAVTVNLVVSGHYMKRKFEFGIYMAIGRKRRDIWKKVASEILTMEGIALLIGAVVNLLFTYLSNELVYIPSGRHLVYCSMPAIIGVLVCMILVTIPLIFFNARSACKADVTEF